MKENNLIWCALSQFLGTQSKATHKSQNELGKIHRTNIVCILLSGEVLDAFY